MILQAQRQQIESHYEMQENIYGYLQNMQVNNSLKKYVYEHAMPAWCQQEYTRFKSPGILCINDYRR